MQCRCAYWQFSVSNNYPSDVLTRSGLICYGKVVASIAPEFLVNPLTETIPASFESPLNIDQTASNNLDCLAL